MNTLKAENKILAKEIQYNEHVKIEDVKHQVSSNGIFFPVSIEHVDLDKFHGDARSFGYNYDDGHCSIVRFEQAVGTLAEDTIDIFERCEKIKKYLKKPTHHILEIIDSDKDCNRLESELLIRYGSEFFYKDSIGYWFRTEYFCCGEPQRVTEESAEIYREVNKEYQRGIIQHNELMKEFLDNIKILKEATDK